MSNIYRLPKLPVPPVFLLKKRKKIVKIIKDRNYFLKFLMTYAKKININMNTYLKTIKKSLVYYNINSLQSNINYLKNKILYSLHQYTGYSNININFKFLKILNDTTLEFEYNFYNLYNTFFIKHFEKDNLKTNSIYLLKYYYKNLSENNYIITNSILKVDNIIENKLLPIATFEELFSEIRYIKPILKYLEGFFKVLMLNNQSIYNRLVLIKNLFYYIYKYQKGHFFRAFGLYSKILFKIYTSKILPIIGLKTIFKGRFGKVRKQISKLQYGYLKLTKYTSQIVYFNNLIKTKRGSYGYHFWFTYKTDTLNIFKREDIIKNVKNTE
jgi:hypothetical protein